uniref:Ubiquitin carboxyl-terminal hydrolase 14 n=1 Tax=Mesocestoides corti TaxID=53468 RepID=A0A5K3F6D3_MESCO
MPVYKVNVKWNSKKFNDLEIDTDASPQDFKALLFSLTGVPPDRQKVMMPGGLLGDTSYDKIRLRNGATVMLMGSVDEPPSTTSVESADPVAQVRKDRKKPSLPVGIVNLGNTCYMNSALQLLFTIPEFRAFLKILPAESLSSMNMESRNVVNTLRLTFELLERTNEPVVPFAFLDALHAAFPQFATLERGDSNPIGGISRYQQQDANECWIEIVRVLQQVTLDSSTLSSSQNIPESFGTEGGWNLVSRFLTGRLVSTLTCTEGDEPPQESVDTFSQLSCFIDKDVKYLHTGLRNGLEGTLTKNSESLEREAVYKKVSQISRLPGYLCVQFIRFFYKEKNQINAKFQNCLGSQVFFGIYACLIRSFCRREYSRIENAISNRSRAYYCILQGSEGC